MFVFLFSSYLDFTKDLVKTKNCIINQFFLLLSDIDYLYLHCFWWRNWCCHQKEQSLKCAKAYFYGAWQIYCCRVVGHKKWKLQFSDKWLACCHHDNWSSTMAIHNNSHYLNFRKQRFTHGVFTPMTTTLLLVWCWGSCGSSFCPLQHHGCVSTVSSQQRTTLKINIYINIRAQWAIFLTTYS